MIKKPMRMFALTLLVGMFLSACNMPITPTPYPTATPEPAATIEPSGEIGGACLIGTWQINDLQSYLQAALPAMIEGATVEIESISGVLTYTFNADGTTLGAANNFVVEAKVGTNGMSLPGEIVVNGASQGNYTVDDAQGILSLSNVGSGNLTLTAKVAGIPVVSETPINDLFMLGANDTASGSTTFQCIGNNLQIAVTVPNMGDRIVTLQRTGQ